MYSVSWRRRAAAAIAATTATVLAAGCATSTAPGVVGIGRQQLLIVPSQQLNQQAALAYGKLSSNASQAGKLNNDSAMATRVRAIGRRLIAQVGVYRPDAAAWAWEINVFDSDQMNAFCAPGGKIGVFSGLIEKLNLTDAELAAVMGHEISHALREHSREQASQRSLSNAVVSGIANSGARSAGTAGLLTGVGAQFLLHLPFSRQMELEADVMGLELMARAGYDPRAAPEVWRKMQRMARGGQVEFLSTHPNDDTRIARLEQAMPKVVPLYERAARAG